MAEPPAYQRIADLIRDRIASGDLPPGSRLPSVRNLVRRYTVSSTTARQALDVLVSSGMVKAVPGSGHYVVDREALDAIAELRERVSRLEQQMREVRGDDG